ncbi:MAG: Rrf2 family transcriptional regulator [Acidobacteriia bacterium]|nr:Rrf2 family transcriptional regulator [Terriglobia bacterium]
MLSATSEYALRALTRLAQLSRGDVILGRDLARSTSVPPQYLAKIMLALRNAGLVLATRGTGGGYMLLRPADAVHLIDVVSLFEGPSTWPHCLIRGDRRCNSDKPCAAHAHWGKVRDGYLEFLERTTLHDISHDTAHPTQLTHPVRRKRAAKSATNA